MPLIQARVLLHASKLLFQDCHIQPSGRGLRVGACGGLPYLEPVIPEVPCIQLHIARRNANQQTAHDAKVQIAGPASASSTWAITALTGLQLACPAWTGPSGPQCLTQVHLARLPDIINCSHQMLKVDSTGTQPIHPHLRACTAVPLRLTAFHSRQRGACRAAFTTCRHR